MAVSGVNSNTTPSTTSGASKQLSETFDNFLTLLTKQLQHQDPLSPMDTNEFTSQLVQYTEVEQSISTNQKLEDLLALQGTNQAMAAMSFLGTTIEAETNKISLGQDGATFEYEMSVPTTGTTISILDSSGKLVRVLEGDKAAGSHSYSWDGKDANGTALPEGVYSIQVTGKDHDGATVEFSTRAVGKVSGVEIREGQVLLNLGELQVPMEYVHAVRPADETAS